MLFAVFTVPEPPSSMPATVPVVTEFPINNVLVGAVAPGAILIDDLIKGPDTKISQTSAVVGWSYDCI